jgi:hypothetical protein
VSLAASITFALVGLAIALAPWVLWRGRVNWSRSKRGPVVDGKPLEWWGKPISPTMLRPSITVAGERAPAEIVEVRDPRIVTASEKRRRPRHSGHQRKVASHG